MKTKKLTLQQKLSKHFGVKIVEGSNSVKAVENEQRTIKAVANTYFFIDSDYDMLITGCAKKSINDRGPQSQAVAKIKHQSDHVLNTKNVVGRITTLDERIIDNKHVLYFESYIPETSKGNDDLINYDESIYDNHSIGFRYKSIIWASKDSEDELSVAAYNEFYPLALNPEKADEFGGFWVVKEIELFEVSVVSYGANELTPVIKSKSKTANEQIKSNLLERVDELTGQLKSNAETKGDKNQIDLQSLQLKQIITDLKLNEPSKKDTSDVEPLNDDTNEPKVKTLIQKLNSNNNN